MTLPAIHTLFLDIGGVLLTNGWDGQARQLAAETIFIDDRMMFAQVAETLGLHGIHHKNFEETKTQLAAFGLTT